MIEVPSLLWQLPAVLSRVDFVSVGSNDLMQYLFASDRGNPKLAQRYDPLSPPFLNVMRDLITRCASADVPISVCGEMAGRPLEAMALVGLGLRRLSAAPAAIGGLKTMIRSLEATALSDYLELLCASEQKSVRAGLKAFAKDRDVAL